MAKGAFDKNMVLFTVKLDLNLMKELVKCYIWSKDLYGTDTWTFRKIEQKYLECIEM